MPCEDVNFDDAVDVGIDNLIDKYPTENELPDKTLAGVRRAGGCRLITDPTQEGSK